MTSSFGLLLWWDLINFFLVSISINLNFLNYVLLQHEKPKLSVIPKFVAAWLCGQFLAYIVNLQSTIISEIEWKGQKFSLNCLLKNKEIDAFQSRYLWFISLRHWIGNSLHFRTLFFSSTKTHAWRLQFLIKYLNYIPLTEPRPCEVTEKRRKKHHHHRIVNLNRRKLVFHIFAYFNHVIDKCCTFRFSS